MRKQISHTEVRKLLGSDYEKIYSQLQTALPADLFIFAKWEAGFGGVYQWTLPDDVKWQPLTSATPYDRTAVIQTYLGIEQKGKSLLYGDKEHTPALEKLVNGIYSVPSEDFVYYTIDADGTYRLLLAGWGFAYPNRSPHDSGLWGSELHRQPDVTVRFVDNGKQVPDLPFEIMLGNGISRGLSTDSDGLCHLGKQSIGSIMNVTVPSAGKQFVLNVVKGQDTYTFDITTVAIAPEIPVEKPKEEEPADTPAAEETPEPQLLIRLKNANGQPMKGITVVALQKGTGRTEFTTDTNGESLLPAKTFSTDTPVDLHFDNINVSLQLEPDEYEYEIVVRDIHKSNVWPTILLIAGAAAAAVGAFYLFAYLTKFI